VAGDTSHIKQSLFVNLAIATAKGVAAAFTGSGALLAETIHSAADCGNQVLLLLGVNQSKRPPDARHPLGYGRALYFWSFMVALLLFSGGGVFSIYEGIHKISHPEPVEKAWLGLLILGFSILLEGYATFSNIKEANVRRKGKPFFQYLRETKDSDFVVVMGENSAATAGLLFAIIALFVASATGDSRWDAAGSLEKPNILSSTRKVR
jgi:cation diffusion facilitator family transporter